jgi:hypothetical protein
MGGAAFNFYGHPRKQETHNLFGPMEHHLIYPGTLQELDHAEPAPWPFQGAYPEVMISPWHPYDPGIEKLYDCTGPYGSSDKYTHHVDQNTWHTYQFGSALTFTARLILQRMGDLPNFNLDSDRGYGWKTWVADRPKTIDTDPSVPVTYIDA